MISCGSVCRRAWKATTGRWLVRALVVCGALSAVWTFVGRAVKAAFASMEITSMGALAANVLRAHAQGMAYTLPSSRAWAWTIGGFLFETFLAYVFVGLSVYGVTRTSMNIARDDGGHWLRDAFDGFLRPLEMAWMLFCQHMAILLWTAIGLLSCMACAVAAAFAVRAGCACLADARTTVIATSVTAVVCLAFAATAFYRYRLAWFLKVDHPERSALSCMSESRRLMNGFKRKAVLVDLSFVWRIVLVSAAFTMLAFAAMAMGDSGTPVYALASVLVVAALVASYYLLFRIGIAMSVALAVLYREIVAEGAA